MKTDELARIEKQLYSSIIEHINLAQSNVQNETLQLIYKQYSEVHSSYAHLAENDKEALKRGLFIQWYAKTEPSFLTGIGILKPTAELKIIQIINDSIKLGLLDDELTWMLNYYANWSFVFDQFIEYSELMTFLENRKDEGIPNLIDREAMKTRGQMGIYWNSLNNLK